MLGRVFAANHHIIAAGRFGFTAGERKHESARRREPEARHRKANSRRALPAHSLPAH